MERIPPEVADQLGYYVYLYVNPFDDHVFYVGKGKGSRALNHLEDTSESRKVEIIRSIRSLEEEPRIEILAHGLKSEREAELIETAAIDLLGVKSLSNRVRGYGSRELGRFPLRQIIAMYRPDPADIKEPVILIRINNTYRHDLSADELYDATRGSWVVGERRESAEYALAVFRSVVREVYKIHKWAPGGSTFYKTDVHPGPHPSDRWEFVGKVAPSGIREKYVDKSVAHYFSPKSQNPIKYVNC